MRVIPPSSQGNSAITDPPLSWCDALEAEFHALRGVAALEGSAPQDPAERLRAVHARIHDHGPSAVCLSGGGIRSSTFALGVLQGLAHIGVLRHIDYLSTVSGGGYTGGWLTTWLHREGPAGRDNVLRAMDPAQAAQLGSGGGPSPVDRLRGTCRYLAPAGGIVSADVWSLTLTMARNLILNWLVILPLLAAILLVPRLYFALVHTLERNITITGVCGWQDLAGPPQWFLIVEMAGFLMASAYLVLNFVGRAGQWSQGRFLCLFLLPSIVSAVSFTLFLSMTPCPMDAGLSVFLWAVAPATGWLVISGARRGVRGVVLALIALVGGLTAIRFAADWYFPAGDELDGYTALGTVILLPVLAALGHRFWPDTAANDGSTLRMRVGARTIIAAMVSGPILGGGTYWFAASQFGFGAGLDEFYAAFAVPILLGLAVLTIIASIGINSSELDDSTLEWWSRTSGWLAIAAMLWAASGFLVLYLADWIESGLLAVSRLLSVEHSSTSAALAILMPLVSSLAGLAVRGMSAEPGKTSKMKLAVQGVALPIVIVLLLGSVAWADLRMVVRLESFGDTSIPCATDGRVVNPCYLPGAGLGAVLTLFGSLLAFGLLMSRTVPVNRFSLHGMYRQRLIRTFLGASRRDRRPNAFTGFDSNDDMRVHDLADVRPLHVINTTLNALQSTHLGRHETKAQSMTFTPLHVGNRFVGYRPSAEYGSDGHDVGTGLSLGMALAVSGAAASSAMGIYSSKARAFLLTVANARLGLWFGNPQSATGWQRSEPPLGVGPLAREMLGLTTDHNPYVYLSDGGHYENLGLWEMVARRCRFIIVADAGCDPTYSFEDLANAVRRIRLDLDIPIEFPPMEASQEGQGRTNQHGAIGVIKYSAVDGPSAPDGTILYLKATLSGDESVDVRNFAAADQRFPHESTANQFFDEARFESYRMLGFHTVMSVTGGEQGIDGAEALCTRAKKVLADQRAAAALRTAAV